MGVATLGSSRHVPEHKFDILLKIKAPLSYRVLSNEKRFFPSYLNPARLLNLTPEIVDRLCNAYQTDLQRKVDFVDEVERCCQMSSSR